MSVHYPILLEYPHLVQKTRSQGVDVVVWTVDEREAIEQLHSMGINRIISNNLAVAQ